MPDECEDSVEDRFTESFSQSLVSSDLKRSMTTMDKSPADMRRSVTMREDRPNFSGGGLLGKKESFVGNNPSNRGSSFN